jgi:hypothetical protein
MKGQEGRKSVTKVREFAGWDVRKADSSSRLIKVNPSKSK